MAFNKRDSQKEETKIKIPPNLWYFSCFSNQLPSLSLSSFLCDTLSLYLYLSLCLCASKQNKNPNSQFHIAPANHAMTFVPPPAPGRELSNPPSDGISNLRFSNLSDHLLVSSWDKVRPSLPHLLTRGLIDPPHHFFHPEQLFVVCFLTWLIFLFWSDLVRASDCTTRALMCFEVSSCTAVQCSTVASMTILRGSVSVRIIPSGGMSFFGSFFMLLCLKERWFKILSLELCFWHWNRKTRLFSGLFSALIKRIFWDAMMRPYVVLSTLMQQVLFLSNFVFST